MANQVLAYKIRDCVSGLFSNGGTNPTFTRVGKVWGSIGHLKNHLRQFECGPYKQYRTHRQGWYGPYGPTVEVVVLRIIEEDVEVATVSHWASSNI